MTDLRSACVCVCVCVYEKKVYKKLNCRWPKKQPLGAVWCKTRLLNSGGQFDRLCNLIGGAILAQVICACAYDYHRLQQWVSNGPKVCVHVCLCICVSFDCLAL